MSSPKLPLNLSLKDVDVFAAVTEPSLYWYVPVARLPANVRTLAGFVSELELESEEYSGMYVRYDDQRLQVGVHLSYDDNENLFNLEVAITAFGARDEMTPLVHAARKLTPAHIFNQVERHGSVAVPVNLGYVFDNDHGTQPQKILVACVRAILVHKFTKLELIVREGKIHTNLTFGGTYVNSWEHSIMK